MPKITDWGESVPAPEILSKSVLFLYNSISVELGIHFNRRFPFLRQYLSDPRTQNLVSIRLGGVDLQNSPVSAIASTTVLETAYMSGQSGINYEMSNLREI